MEKAMANDMKTGIMQGFKGMYMSYCQYEAYQEGSLL